MPLQKEKNLQKRKNDTTLVVPKPKENKDSVEYRKLIKDAVSKEGLLTTHFTPQRKLYWEIPDSAFEHTYMLSNRIAATSNTQDFVAGQMATQPILLQLSRDSINVYLHKVQTQKQRRRKKSRLRQPRQELFESRIEGFQNRKLATRGMSSSM